MALKSIRIRRGAVAIAAAAGLLATAAHAEPEKVAVFDFQFAKTAQVPPTEDDIARLKRTSDEFRSLLKDSGRYEVVSTDAVRAEAQGKDLRACGGCAEEFAKKLGAQAAITGEVQKVSNLILNINVYLKPLTQDAQEKAYSVDLRGDTDESFDRGIKYLVKNQFLVR